MAERRQGDGTPARSPAPTAGPARPPLPSGPAAEGPPPLRPRRGLGRCLALPALCCCLPSAAAAAASSFLLLFLPACRAGPGAVRIAARRRSCAPGPGGLGPSPPRRRSLRRVKPLL